MEYHSYINFYFEDLEEFPFPDKIIREWILCIITHENSHPGNINFIFCSDAYLSKLNVEYLKHDTLTDIISFDYSDEFTNVSGDIFISIERVQENSKKFNISFQEEFLRILSHGVLHLLGYDDKSVTLKTEMTRKENFYLNLFDLSVF